jgi:hypothetical protein
MKSQLLGEEIGCVMPSAIPVQVQVLNNREYNSYQYQKARRSYFQNARTTNRTALFISNKRGGVISRKTVYSYDLILQAHPAMDDYRRDPQTREPLWDQSQPWNEHQVYCLRLVADFMFTPSVCRNTEGKKRKYRKKGIPTRTPDYEDLDRYLAKNAHLFTHEHFFKEHFKWPAHTAN